MSQLHYIKYLQNLLDQHGISYLTQQKLELQQNNIPQNNGILSQTTSSITSNKLETSMKTQLQGKLVERYSRQMLLKQISYQGQLKIINSKVALIGAGGIGCPLAIYLAGAGIGTIGLFDSDTVDVTNLHRQIGHANASIGLKKTQSLKNTLLAFNPNIKINQHSFVTVQSCHQLNDYDFVIDGSDNPQCRYIVNDFCIINNKKLLSGACIGWEGQITCYGGENGPCYRCIWGNQQKTTGGCSTLGVVGMLPGFVGIILALQAIKLIINGISSLQGNLLTYESKSMTFKRCKLRAKVKQCIGCGQSKLNMKEYEYSKHAVCKPDLSNLPVVEEISWKQFIERKIEHKILDVRPANQYNICHLKNTVNIPYEKLSQYKKDELIKQLNSLGFLNANGIDNKKVVYVSCNRGVMSKRASNILNLNDINGVSIKGGITQYSRCYDSNIPIL